MLITENNRNAQAEGWTRSQNVQENVRFAKCFILGHIRTIPVYLFCFKRTLVSFLVEYAGAYQSEVVHSKAGVSVHFHLVQISAKDQYHFCVYKI